MDTSQDFPQRIVPQNIDAEQALLGALLTNSLALERVSDFLRPLHFASPVHGNIYQAILTLQSRGVMADPVVLKGYLSQDEGLNQLGGIKYLMDIVSSSVTIINVVDYAKLIFDRYLRRQLIGIGTDIVNDAYDINLENEASSQMAQAEKKLYELGSEGQIEGGPQEFHEALIEVIQEVAEARKKGGISGEPSGFRDLDNKMGGLHKSDLIIVAGRPGMGKTAFATCLAFNTARSFLEKEKNAQERKSVAFFSLEMSSSQLAGRILAMETQIASDQLRNGKITKEEFQRVVGFNENLEKIPLYIDDSPGLTVSAIHSRCRRLKRDASKGLGLIVIDYLQLIDMSTTSFKGDMVRALTETTRLLKIMAKDLNVPVIVLSQLNRSVEQREDKRPLLSDLRDSGSIEQDADVVMFVFREYYYLKKNQPTKKEFETDDKLMERIKKWEEDIVNLEKKAELIIAKQRHGATGFINLSFEGQFTRFGDWIDPSTF